MTNRPSVAPADRKRLVLGPVIPKTLKMGVVPACMVLRMK